MPVILFLLSLSPPTELSAPEQVDIFLDVRAEGGVYDNPGVGHQHVDASGLLTHLRVERDQIGQVRDVGPYPGGRRADRLHRRLQAVSTRRLVATILSLIPGCQLDAWMSDYAMPECAVAPEEQSERSRSTLRAGDLAKMKPGAIRHSSGLG